MRRDLPSKSNEILALAREKSASAQKDLAQVKAFLKELVAKEAKIVEVTKTNLEDLNAEDETRCWSWCSKSSGRNNTIWLWRTSS